MHLDQQFEGQSAVVTGGAQGLGFATATLLASRGASICLLDKNSEKLAAAVEKLRAQSFNATGIVSDVSSEESVNTAAQKALALFGKIDILVNNAGWFPFTNVMSVTADEWDRVFEVNTKSVFLCSRAFGKPMMAAGYGRIVSIVSSGAYGPNPTLPHYAAAKAALISVIRTFALEFAPHQVLVNGVSPGNIATETSANDAWLVERVPKIPVRRAAQPEEIAEIIAFLASRQNSYIVGETIIASGGFVMA